MDLHEILLDSDGNLSDAAESIILFRNHLGNMPQTASIRKLRDIPSIRPNHFRQGHIEFARSWIVPDHYASGPEVSVVNPNALDVHRYSDLIVECECGVHVTRTSKNGTHDVIEQSGHREYCLPYYPLRARAKLSHRSHSEIRRLGRMGWRASDIASRLHCDPSRLRAIAREFGLSIRDLNDEFRRLGGNTYRYLVREEGYSAQLISDIYDRSKRTMAKWAKEYGDREPEIGVTEFGRNADGTFGWRTRAKRPSFLQ